MRTKFTQSARRHRIGKAHVLYVMETVQPTISINTRGEKEYEWIGQDERGVELEIVGAIVEDDLLLVFHVMPGRYRRN